MIEYDWDSDYSIRDITLMDYISKSERILTFRSKVRSAFPDLVKLGAVTIIKEKHSNGFLFNGAHALFLALTSFPINDTVASSRLRIINKILKTCKDTNRLKLAYALYESSPYKYKQKVKLVFCACGAAHLLVVEE